MRSVTKEKLAKIKARDKRVKKEVLKTKEIKRISRKNKLSAELFNAQLFNVNNPVKRLIPLKQQLELDKQISNVKELAKS